MPNNRRIQVPSALNHFCTPLGDTASMVDLLHIYYILRVETDWVAVGTSKTLFILPLDERFITFSPIGNGHHERSTEIYIDVYPCDAFQHRLTLLKGSAASNVTD